MYREIVTSPDPISPFFFERSHFETFARAAAAAFRDASPFPHAVIENFLPSAVAARLADEFPAPTFSGFRQRDDAHQKRKLAKLEESDFRGVPPFTRQVLSEFNGKVFLDFLEALTGISGLIADPHFNGGALHQILPGGKLGIHADFNRDERRKLDRRLNVLIYLNREWREEYGGHLELWDQTMSRCERRLAPVFNRCVIFATDSTSYHGHPDPLACPADRTRNSIALYYYTSGRDAGPSKRSHDTLFRLRPGEAPPPEDRFSERLKRLAADWLPPILLQSLRRLRHT